MIIRWRHLNNVCANHIGFTEPAHNFEKFSAGHAAGFGGAGARRHRWIKHINIDRHIDLCVANSCENTPEHFISTEPIKVAAVNDREAELFVVFEIFG